MAAAQRWTLRAAIAVALLLPAASVAGPPTSGPGSPAKNDDDTPAKKKDKPKAPPKNLAVKAMRLVIEDAAFEDMTFEEFTEWLTRTTKANVVVRWKVIEKAGVERDCPISLKRREITVRKLLPLVFEQVTEGLTAVELAAKADGNTLILSTRKEINARRFARVYDVQDLLISVPNFEAMGTTEGRDIEAERGKTPRVVSDTKKSKCPPQAQRLIDLIMTHIQPLSWKVNGGKGTIVYHNGKLVVYNNIEVHQQIGGAIAPQEEKK